MSKKILIVDDNAFMVEIMTYILNNKGYDVIPLYNCEEVLYHIKYDNPDLVILDTALPGMDGKDLCKLIKLNKDTKNLRVIMCAGDDEANMPLNQQGAPDDVLHKPFDMSSLLSKVDDQLAA